MSTHTEVAKGLHSPKKSSFNIWMIIFAILTVVGVVCWITQLTQGIQVTNLGVENMWGLYITFFMTFTGVAAGCLFFASIPYLFKLDAYKPYTRIATYVGAVSSIVAASLFIVVDIGNPERAWLFITSGNFSSPMYWDFLMLASYMIISLIFTRQLLLVNEGKKEEKSVLPIAVIAFIAGLMVVVTSFVFTFQNARPMWNSPAQSVSFTLSAFVAALSVLTILAFILNKSGYIKMPLNLIEKIGKLAAGLLIVELILVIIEPLAGIYSGAGPAYEATLWLVAGEGAVLFWLEMILLIGAIILLAKAPSAKGGSLLAGAIMAIATIVLIKTNFLQTELFHPVLNLPGPAMHGSEATFYYPSLIEIGLSIGIMSLGALLVGLGLKLLNLGKNNQ